MAVAFDAVGPSSAGASATAAASLTWSHTNGASANGIIAGCAVGSGSDGGMSTTATYAGTAMTAGAIVHSNASSQGFLRVFTLMSPTTGANNVVVTLTGGSATLSGGSISATGVGSFKAQHSATGTTTPTATSSGSTSDGLIAAFCALGTSISAATAPSTSRFIKNVNADTAAGNCAGATSPGTGSNVTTAWTPAEWFAVIGVELLATTAPVAHVATGTRSAGGTTTVAPAYPAGVAAGVLAIASRVIKPSTATGTAEAGWTQALNVTGGTGTAGNDTGPTRLTIETKELAGGESGSVTFDNAATPNSSHAIIQLYSKTAGLAWDVAISSGDDAVHSVGRNATGGALALAPDDVLVVIAGSDSDNATAWTSQTITAPGITFGAVTQRLAPGGVTTGFQSGLVIHEATVTAGTATAAPTFSATAATGNNCGPVGFVRLRAGAATTAVGDTVELDWSVAQAVGDPLQTVWHTAKAQGDTLQAVWNVSIPVADTLGLPWTVRQAAGDPLQAIWTVAQAVGDSSVLRWNTGQTVGDPLGLIWNVSIPLADALDVRWATTILAGDSTQLIWHVRGLAGVSPAFVWNTLEAVTPLGDTLSLVWDVRQAVGDPVALVWHTAATAGDALDARWSVRVAIGDPLGLVWNVAVPLSDTLGLVWAVRQAVGDPLDLRWTVHQAISDLLGIMWDVEAAAGVVGDSLELPWDVRVASAASVQVLWQDLVPVSDLLALRWNTQIPATDSLGLQWSVRAAHTSLLGIMWDVSSVSGETISLVWQDLATISDTLVLQWTVRQATAALLGILWDTESDIETISVAPDLIYAHGKLHLLVDDFLALQL